MNTKREIDKALMSHIAWRERLVLIIENKTDELRSGAAASSHECDFGKWLNAHSPRHPKEIPAYEKIKDLHAQFHKESERIVNLAVENKRDEALAALAKPCKFARLSGALAMALHHWQTLLK